MADAAIGATIQVVLETVLSLANDRIVLILGLKEELETVSKTAERIRGLLADADNNKHNPAVLNWLKVLEGEVFKAENVLDEVNYENLRREVKCRSQLKRKVCFFFSFFRTIGFRSRMASKLRDINTKLQKINREANEVGLVVRFHIDTALSATDGAATSRQTDSVVVANVVGRDNDQSKIVELLLSRSDKVVSVIPIFGPAGMGKTTLAKSVYNDPKIAEHFVHKGEKDNRIWVCVAKKITLVELFKVCLESLSRQKVSLDNRQVIIQNIKDELEGQRYLLVLDDVWNDEGELWKDFLTTLEGLNAANGSCCLVTTRIRDVPSTLPRHLKNIVHPYELRKLTDDDCWSILKGKAIAPQEIPRATKKQILNRCAGLPLSATLFGSLLQTNREEERASILQKSLLGGDQDTVEQILKVSFDHLSPASVKKCFVYCSIFPQDTKLEKDLLIELWMAEGFLQPDPMEVIGDKYFKILLQSSLLEEVEGRRTSYKMHDLVHDFAKSALNKDRYLVLDSFEGMSEDTRKKHTTSVRTLFLKSISGDILSKFKCLHVLKLYGEDVKVLPDSIGKLIHLRVLDISNSGITILPESLCKLYNLQTLRIEDDKLEVLPKQMSNLISLRHLHYCDTHVEFQMPSDMGQLTRLQTLKFFNIGQEDGCGIEELGSLKYLEGSLEIRNLELVNGKKGAEGAKLFEKSNLSTLKFLWGSEDRERDTYDENVLEGLQPHQNLEKLEIRNFMGDQFPGWFINLSTLVKLKFIDCKSCRDLPTLGQLSCLESLVLKGLENVRSIGLSFYGIGSDGDQVKKFFPALKYLSLEDMENLAEWKDEHEVRSTRGAAEVDLFPVLERLSIKNCSQLTSAPSPLPSIEHLDIGYNCHISLLKKIVSSYTTILSFELSGYGLNSFGLSGYGLNGLHNDLHFFKLHRMNDIEKDAEYHLSFKGCESLASEILKLCVALQELKICDHKLTSLSGEMLESCASLRVLKVQYCSDLVSFPHDLRQTPYLEILIVSHCPKLMIADMPKGFASLTSLKELEIGPLSINEITEFDWSGLIYSSSSTLTSLVLYGVPEVESLPEQLQYLTSLQFLHLQGFGIKALPDWIGNLTSLEHLNLFACEELLRLPSVATKERLTKLINLGIGSCPLLEERGNPQSGTNSEWPISPCYPRDRYCYYSDKPYPFDYTVFATEETPNACCIC